MCNLNLRVFSTNTKNVFTSVLLQTQILGVSVTSCLFQSTFYHFKYFSPSNFVVASVPLQAYLFVWLDTSLQAKIL